MAILEVGTKAPDFTLPTTGGAEMDIATLMGPHKFLVMAFFPKARTSVCGEELALINEFLEEFTKRNAAVAAFSVDTSAELQSWADDEKFEFTLVSDASPKGEVAKAYGVWNEEHELSERAIFIIDEDGRIVYSYLSPMLENPGVTRIFDELDNF